MYGGGKRGKEGGDYDVIHMKTPVRERKKERDEGGIGKNEKKHSPPPPTRYSF